MTSSTRDRAEPSPTEGLGAAATPWNDYRGTAAADDAIALLGTRSLYDIAGLDRRRWHIVGIDASLTDAQEHVVVYAADRATEPGARVVGTDELAVTAFHLSPSTPVDRLLREAFQRVTLRLVSTAAADRELRVAEHVEL